MITDKIKQYLIILGLVALFSAIVAYQANKLTALKEKNESLTSTKEVLLDSIRHYRTENGLQAAEIGEIRITVDELKKYRTDDAKLIESLKTKGRNTERFVSVNTTAKDTILSIVRDSVIRRDTVLLTVRSINIDKKWYSIHGYIDGDSIKGALTTRSSLKIVETVKYKRFLGFLWKTNKVKNRKVDVTSLNPNEEITDIEFLVIEN